MKEGGQGILEVKDLSRNGARGWESTVSGSGEPELERDEKKWKPNIL